MTGFNESFHYWSIALKEKDDQTGEYPSVPVRGGIMARGSAFEGEPTVETSDWEGHTGSKSIVIASDRTSARSSPTMLNESAVCVALPNGSKIE